MEEVQRWKQQDMGGASRKIANVLDAIGFSEKTRTIISDSTVLRDTNFNLLNALSDCVHNSFTIGSRCEGTTNASMNSDIDIVHYSPLVKVFESVRKQTICLSNTHLITVNDNCTPEGYTKLQIVQNGEIVQTESNIIPIGHQFEKFKLDTSGRLVLSNDVVRYTKITVHERNGPADTIFVDDFSHEPTDHVRAYRFDEVPDALKSWFRRPRHNAWPSKKTLKLCNRMGCFVVPIGKPYSQEKGLQWRFSMSFQERHLMLNLSEAQYKCYILLKLIKKFLIKPKFGNVISSYHCKTSLFYTIERNENITWNTQYLLMNLISCLEQLLQWVQENNCPNFFLPDENMFVSKFTKKTQVSLQQFIKDLISGNCIELVTIKFKNFGELLLLDTDLSYERIYAQIENEIWFAKFVHDSLSIFCNRILHAEVLEAINECQKLKRQLPEGLLNQIVCSDPTIKMTAVANMVAILREIQGESFVYGIHPKKLALKGIYDSCLSGDTLKMISYKSVPNLIEILQTYAKQYFNIYIKFCELCYHKIDTDDTGGCFIPIEQAMRFISYNHLELLINNSFDPQAELISAKIEYSCSHKKLLVLKGLKLAESKLYTDKASLLAAEYVRKRDTIDSNVTIDESLNYFKKSQSVNYVSSGLKFARMYMTCNMFFECRELLKRMVGREKESLHTCTCYDKYNSRGNHELAKLNRMLKQRTLELIENSQIEYVNEDRFIKQIGSLFTNCVIYELYELDVVDAPLFYEAFRSFGAPPGSREDIYDHWFDRAVIDPVVYLHCMLIECCDQLNDRSGSAASLGVLENLLFTTCDNSLRHLETAMNYIGHVYIKKGWTKLALECYQKSFKVRLLHNAAKWHVMFMLFGQ